MRTAIVRRIYRPSVPAPAPRPAPALTITAVKPEAGKDEKEDIPDHLPAWIMAAVMTRRAVGQTGAQILARSAAGVMLDAVPAEARPALLAATRRAIRATAPPDEPAQYDAG